MKAILSQALKAIAIGFLMKIFSDWLNTDYLDKFFANNLITILVALLAINTTTLSIILTKIRELIDQHGGGDFFAKTKANMLLTIKEQIALIVLAVIFLSAKDSILIAQTENMPLLLDTLTFAVFSYALMTLYDTAKCVFLILDYKAN